MIDSESHVADNPPPNTRVCPACNGEIKGDAVKCKHCGVMFQEVPNLGANGLCTKVCYFCKETIHLEAIKCKHCGSMLNEDVKCSAGSTNVRQEMTSPHVECSNICDTENSDLRVNDWLNSIGMQEYIGLFALHNIKFEDLLEISDDDMIKLGLKSIGHRKLMLNRIAENRALRTRSESQRQFVYIKGFFVVLGGLSAFIIMQFNEVTVANRLLMWVCALLFLAIYFLPTTIAFIKGNEFRWGIFLVNTFFGISFIGWVIALVVSMGLLSAQTGAILAFLAPNRGLKG